MVKRKNQIFKKAVKMYANPHVREKKNPMKDAPKEKKKVSPSKRPIRPGA